MSLPLTFSGVMPANLLPFKADLSIDEVAYRRHLRWLADTRGVTGIVANGHAAEVSSLTREERNARPGHRPRRGRRRRARWWPASTRTARGRPPQLARDAKAAGASGLLVFPPTLFMWGAQLKPDMVIRHFPEIAAGDRSPHHRLRVPAGLGHRLRSRRPWPGSPRSRSVAGVKDWSNDIVAFERNLRAVRATGRPVAMLSSFTMSLMSTFLLGADGAISGMGSVVADLQAELFDLCQKGDLDGARQLNDRLDPLVRVFYAPPFVDMHNRMKEALVILGRIPAAHVRPPLTPVSDAERAAIRARPPGRRHVGSRPVGAAVRVGRPSKRRRPSAAGGSPRATD